MKKIITIAFAVVALATTALAQQQVRVELATSRLNLNLDSLVAALNRHDYYWRIGEPRRGKLPPSQSCPDCGERTFLHQMLVGELRTDGQGITTSKGGDMNSLLQQLRDMLGGSSCRTISDTLVNICEGGEYEWHQEKYTSAGTYLYYSARDTLGCDTAWILNLDVVSIPRRDTSAILTEGDSISWRGQSITGPGTYQDTIAGIPCDSLIVLTVKQAPTPPDPCVAAREAWLGTGNWWLEFDVKRTWNAIWNKFTWTNRWLYQFGGAVDYKSKNGWAFKDPCVGESLRLRLLLGRLNWPVAASGNCLACNNVRLDDDKGFEASLTYQVTWLRGWPWTVSAGVGPYARYQRLENTKSLGLGIVFNTEVECFVGKGFVSLVGGTEVAGVKLHGWSFSPYIGVRIHPVALKKGKNLKKV